MHLKDTPGNSLSISPDLLFISKKKLLSRMLNKSKVAFKTHWRELFHNDDNHECKGAFSMNDTIPIYLMRLSLSDSNAWRSCWSVGRVLSFGLEGPGSRPTWRKLPCMLMAPGACEIRRLFPSKLCLWWYVSGGAIPPWRIKIAIARLRNILRDEYQTVSNNPLALL